MLTRHRILDDAILGDQMKAFLQTQDLLVEVDDFDEQLFVDYNLGFEMPYEIGNGIIWLKENSPVLNALDSITQDFETLGVKHLEIFLADDIEDSYLMLLNFLKSIAQTYIECIDIHLPIVANGLRETLKKISELKDNQSVRNFYAYGLDSPLENELPEHVINTGNPDLDYRYCGIVSTSYFMNNPVAYNLSNFHNTCLYKKIAIDLEGNIKNCPSMKESFGNVQDTRLVDAVRQQHFKKYWSITKDQIDKCKDCEFRHICTDCRAYTDDPTNPYAAPLKCGYDPYTCEWQDWSLNPLKYNAMDYYDMKNIVTNG
jgi:SPASM domain peptide maturase of grasp-with-spasm system